MKDWLKNRYKFYSLILACFVLFLFVVFFAFFYRREKEELTLEDTVKRENVQRARIVDRNGNVLAWDDWHNRLVFNYHNFNYFVKKGTVNKEEVEDFVNNNIKADFSINDKGNVYLLKDLQVIEREKLFSKIESRGFEKFLYFEDYITRAVREYSVERKNFLTLVGKIDDKTRKGVEGLEKDYDQQILNGEELSLSVDFFESVDLAESLGKVSGKFSILKVDKLSGKVISFYSSADKIAEDELSKLFSFEDISGSNVFTTLKVASMIERDPTLIEEYYCKGQEPCKERHGLVNLNNILSCPSSVENLLEKNYKKEDLGKIISVDFDISSNDLKALIELGFLAFSNDYIPKFSYLKEYENSVKSVKLNEKTVNFLRQALREQVEDVRVFADENFIYFVASREGKGREVERVLLGK